MTITAKITDYDSMLNKLISCLGLRRDELLKGEGKEEISFGPWDADLTVLQEIHQPDLDRWFDQFGDALEISLEISQVFEVPESKIWLATKSLHDAASLADFVAYCNRYSAGINLKLNLQKDLLVTEIRQCMVDNGYEIANETTILIFFSSERLHDIFSKSNYSSFEKTFFKDKEAGYRRLLILVADLPGRMLGPYFGILGKNEYERYARFFHEIPSFEALDAVREIMAKNCNWDGRPEFLTPDVLKVSAYGVNGLRSCRGEVVRLLNELAVPYLANRTVRDGGQLRATFEGERSVEVTIEAEGTLLKTYRLYQWAYESKEMVTTRLDVVRRVIASRLPPPPGNFNMLTKSGLALWKECKIQLRVLIDRNLIESFERRREAADGVRQYVDDVGERIRSLTKEVVDNTYKTVGLLVGVVIAYLLKPDQGPTIFVLGLSLYVAYILFVRFFYLRFIHDDYQAKKQAFTVERAAIENSKLLDMSDLTSVVQKKNNEFEARFKTVSGIYYILIVIAALLFIGWWGVGQQQASPEKMRGRALIGHAKRLVNLGYHDIRVNLREWSRPMTLHDKSTGKTLVPDLTAIRRDNVSVVLEYVPCSKLGNADTLARLRLLRHLAENQGAEFQMLILAVCGTDPGHERLHEWVRGDALGQSKIWSW